MAASGGAQDRMPPIPADKLTDAQKQADRGIQGGAIGGHLRTVHPAAAQPGGDEPRARDGRLPALQELAAAAAERVRHPADRAPVDAAVRVERAPAAAHSRRAAGRHRHGDRRGAASRAAWRTTRKRSTRLWDELQRNQSVSDATYARAVAKIGEQGVIDVLGHHRLLHDAGDGDEHGADAAAGRASSRRWRRFPRVDGSSRSRSRVTS